VVKWTVRGREEELWEEEPDEESERAMTACREYVRRMIMGERGRKERSAS
jgi:hypothetical protein